MRKQEQALAKAKVREAIKGITAQLKTEKSAQVRAALLEVQDELKSIYKEIPACAADYMCDEDHMEEEDMTMGYMGEDYMEDDVSVDEGFVSEEEIDEGLLDQDDIFTDDDALPTDSVEEDFMAFMSEDDAFEEDDEFMDVLGEDEVMMDDMDMYAGEDDLADDEFDVLEDSDLDDFADELADPELDMSGFDDEDDFGEPPMEVLSEDELFGADDGFEDLDDDGFADDAGFDSLDDDDLGFDDSFDDDDELTEEELELVAAALQLSKHALGLMANETARNEAAAEAEEDEEDTVEYDGDDDLDALSKEELEALENVGILETTSASVSLVDRLRAAEDKLTALAANPFA